MIFSPLCGKWNFYLLYLSQNIQGLVDLKEITSSHLIIARLQQIWRLYLSGADTMCHAMWHSTDNNILLLTHNSSVNSEYITNGDAVSTDYCQDMASGNWHSLNSVIVQSLDEPRGES